MNKQIIENNPIVLATAMQGGKPNQVVVAYAKLEKDKIIITDNYMSQTIKDLRHNPSVCLAVWDKGWHGLKIIGSAKYYTSGKWFEFIQKMQENNNMPRKGAVVVTIEKIINLK